MLNSWFYSKVEHPALAFSELCKKSRSTQANAYVNGPTFFLSARYALAALLRSLKIDSSHHVLVPAYHCGSEVGVFYRFTSDVDYYGMDNKLHPQVTEIEKRVKTNTKVILVIHYFGFVTPLQELKQLCERYKIILIEDACHLLPTAIVFQRKSSEQGDFILFSLKKFLPVADGGLLYANSALEKNALASQKNILQEELLPCWFLIAKREAILAALKTEHSILKAYHLWRFCCLHFMSRFRGKAVAANHNHLLALEQEDFDPGSEEYGCSDFSKAIFFSSDLEAIAKRRRENYEFLCKNVKSKQLLLVKGELNALDMPMLFPFFHQENSKKQHTWIHHFWKGKFNQRRDHSFTLEERFYKELKVIPIHQDIVVNHLKAAIKEL
ncbi:MAG: DegT/DnrJ/EryC1/StrS aminotransferase family protein [Oligoflexia bacterium]|nr:DegT/DnrJ/EryC1/StrS aminotransferase family protein [Oligoflexia bacterium]